MNYNLRMRILNVPTKLSIDLRISIDERHPSLYSNVSNNTSNITIGINPLVIISLIRAPEIDENGMPVRSQWNRNDNLCLTKYSLPIFIEELNGIKQDLKKTDLYTYYGNRLEVNEKIAEEIRRVFMVSNTTIELSAVVITQPDETRVEGIKMKFNNEQSSVLLTLNELTTIEYNLNHLDINTSAMIMYSEFCNKTIKPTTESFTHSPSKQNVDITPKTSTKLSDFDTSDGTDVF